VKFSILFFFLFAIQIQIQASCKTALIAKENQDASLAGTSPVFTEVLIMNGDAARNGFMSDSFGPHQLLVVDEFPTDLDKIPFVAGIVCSNVIPEGSHVYFMAKKMGIPILHWPSAIHDSALRSLLDESGVARVLEIDSNKENFSVRHASEEDLARRPKFDIPKGKIFKNYNKIPTETELAEMSVEKLRLHFGEKSAYMLWASRFLSKENLPSMFPISLGHFIGFQRAIQVADGVTLESFIAKTVEEIAEQPSNQLLRIKKLDEIRHRVELAEMPPSMLQPIIDQIIEQYGSIHMELRFRSSNAVEDSLGAGIFESFTLAASFGKSDAERIAEIESIIKQLWASEYSYRAFNMREYAGIAESNESIGILLHPSVTQPTSTAVGSIKEVHGSKIYDVIVYPGSNSATSPSLTAKPQAFRLTISPAGEMNFVIKGSGVVLTSVGSSVQDFIGDVEMFLSVESFGVFQSFFDIADKVHAQWVKENPKENPEFSFEYINVQKQTGAHTRVIPTILQIKKRNSTATVIKYEPAPHITPEVIDSFTRYPRNPYLDEALSELPKGTKLFSDYLFSTKQGASGENKVMFFDVDVNGNRTMLTVQGESNPAEAARKLHEYFYNQNVNFKILEYGHLSGLVSGVSGNKIIIDRVSFTGNSDHDEAAFKGFNRSVSPEVFSLMLQGMVEKGFIEFDPDATVSLELTRYLGIDVNTRDTVRRISN